ncbi:ribosomal protein S6 modification protein [Candidatus Filomicrobium marinum]|uniref:Probable alpha-L-glutamate ligase n=2 Tax=Filomicrobium TaxID=119044 RepID=A0A0D6JC62_9HYPH|nr:MULTISPECIES: 30S ribosomal protein S6--L-glutamate ligase [Filomicrobium]MCV0370464.1 30S ribosomal protein S6--L-glutamate ligase [Filomicrobium sp.]CFX08924.1 ribosomal protein S6 modification protein [Candidatus Filomicrobium marinum]CPR16873.1 ribosomal protein S6 modification protein [Candidatus Filomicrobium marinum]SDO43461.1 SSU ribosomal protein S6P modification protein [Filomicrobium insigne]
MKIALMCVNPKLYTHRRLIEVAEQRGHQIDVIPTLRVTINIASHKPSLYLNGQLLSGYDAVIPRIGASITFFGLAVLRQFEMMGVYPLNESVGIGRSRDKLRSMQLLSRKGIGLPVTIFAQDPKKAAEVVELAGGAPVVIKLLEGTQGIGVVLAETPKSAQSVIEAFAGANVNILVQEFIKEAGGSDIRCFVIGDRVIAAMQRQGAEGDFRSNLHRGGTATPIRITPQERAAAVGAAKAMGLNVCGVDMLRANHGPVIMEVNSSPGIEGLEKATGIDVASKMIEFLETHAKPGKTRTKGRG